MHSTVVKAEAVSRKKYFLWKYFISKMILNINPVSYTHLDVYKRQLIKISVWRTIHDFHVLRFIFKIVYKMRCFHRNYFFPLIASALTIVLWSLTYTTTRYRTRFFLMMAVDGTAETSGIAENIGLRPNNPGKNFNNKLLPVSYTHLYGSVLLDVPIKLSVA